MNVGKVVLIIDDDSRNLFALRLALKSRGYTAICCHDAKEGMALLKSEPAIDIVLLDMMMPDMDGYEALAHLRAIEEYKCLPLIAVTAQAMPGDRERCLAAGAWDYVSKPIDIDKLMTAIERVI